MFMTKGCFVTQTQTQTQTPTPTQRPRRRRRYHIRHRTSERYVQGCISHNCCTSKKKVAKLEGEDSTSKAVIHISIHTLCTRVHNAHAT